MRADPGYPGGSRSFDKDPASPYYTGTTGPRIEDIRDAINTQFESLGQWDWESLIEAAKTVIEVAEDNLAGE